MSMSTWTTRVRLMSKAYTGRSISSKRSQAKCRFNFFWGNQEVYDPSWCITNGSRGWRLHPSLASSSLQWRYDYLFWKIDALQLWPKNPVAKSANSKQRPIAPCDIWFQGGDQLPRGAVRADALSDIPTGWSAYQIGEVLRAPFNGAAKLVNIEIWGGVNIGKIVIFQKAIFLVLLPGSTA